MNDVDVEDLYPGETALSAEKIAEHRAILAAGGELAPIHVLRDGTNLIVRDGNNRVRAFVEHSQDAGQPIGRISCVEVTMRPDALAIQVLRECATYYGRGREAFLAIPSGIAQEYGTLQAQIGNNIRRKARFLENFRAGLSMLQPSANVDSPHQDSNSWANMMARVDLWLHASYVEDFSGADFRELRDSDREHLSAHIAEFRRIAAGVQNTGPTSNEQSQRGREVFMNIYSILEPTLSVFRGSNGFGDE